MPGSQKGLQMLLKLLQQKSAKKNSRHFSEITMGWTIKKLQIFAEQLINPAHIFDFPLSNTEVKYWLSGPDSPTTLGGWESPLRSIQLQNTNARVELSRPSKIQMLSGFVAKVVIDWTQVWSLVSYLATLTLLLLRFDTYFTSSRRTWSPWTHMQVGPTSLNVQNQGLSLGAEHPESLNDRIVVGFLPENEVHHNFCF